MMNHRGVGIKGGSKKKRPRWPVLVAFGTMIALGVLLLVIAGRTPRKELLSKGQVGQGEIVEDEGSAKPQAAVSGGGENETSATNLVEDDGKTLWVSPTEGGAIDLSYLPPGVQVVVAVRPAAIAENADGAKAIEAAMPILQRDLKLVWNDLRGLSDADRLVLGFGIDSAGVWKVSEVVHLTGQSATEFVKRQLASAEQKEHGGQRYWVRNGRAYLLPQNANDTLVVTSQSEIEDVIDLAGEVPPLRRDVERLLEHTDADRDFTLIVTPNSLFSDGRGMFAGEWSGLREPLFWFLGDELSAAALSLDWGESFYFEFTAVPTLDTSTERAARILKQRVDEIPGKLDAYVVGMTPHEYGRAIVARLPAMVRKLQAYTRSGMEGKVAVLNGYLPVVAGHNLLLGAELLAAEASGGARGSMVAEATMPSGEEEDVQENGGEGGNKRSGLERVTSLQFSRDTLETAIELLSRDVGVPIVIRGADLQAEGITKNQSFGISVEGKPAKEILVEILRLANPDKTASGPADEKQKLVYVVDRGNDGIEQVIVTTRSAVAARGEELPRIFRGEER